MTAYQAIAAPERAETRADQGATAERGPQPPAVVPAAPRVRPVALAPAPAPDSAAEVADPYLAPALRAAAAARAAAARIRGQDHAGPPVPRPLTVRRREPGKPTGRLYRGLSVSEAAAASRIAFRPLRRAQTPLPYRTEYLEPWPSAMPAAEQPRMQPGAAAGTDEDRFRRFAHEVARVQAQQPANPGEPRALVPVRVLRELPATSLASWWSRLRARDAP